MRSLAVPLWKNPSACAPPRDTSISLSLTNGPRSFTTASIVLPVLTFVNLSIVPNGRVRCATLYLFGSNLSPLAVLAQHWYQVAVPWYFFLTAGLSTALTVVQPESTTAQHKTKSFISYACFSRYAFWIQSCGDPCVDGFYVHAA